VRRSRCAERARCGSVEHLLGWTVARLGENGVPCHDRYVSVLLAAERSRDRGAGRAPVRYLEPEVYGRDPAENDPQEREPASATR
jgi:hypothetical protein